MSKVQRKSTICFLTFLSFFCSYNHSAANDSCFQGLSTITGNVTYPAGWRPYIFEFTLYDGYGTPLDNTRGVVIYYRSQNYSKRSADYTYKAPTGKFEFSIPQSYWDEDGYWISYTCSYEGTPVGPQGGGIETQYPGKVWSTEKEFSADKIQGGDYSDTVHFFNATGLPDDIDYEIVGGYDCPEDLGPDGRAVWFDYSEGGWAWYYLAPNTGMHRFLKVESSCSYRVSCTDFTESSPYVDDQYKYWDGDDEIWAC